MGLGIVYLQKAQFLTEKIPMNHDKLGKYSLLSSLLVLTYLPSASQRF